MIYYAINRGNLRDELFRKPEDYFAFIRVLAEGLEKYPVELFAFTLMPNHWHLVLRPAEDGQMGRLLRWVTATDSLRIHAHDHTRGHGHLYQSRFKSFPVQDDSHFYTVCRNVERYSLLGCGVLAIASFALAIAGKHKTLSGQLWGVIGLSVPCVPILLAGNLTASQTAEAWGTWLIGFAATTMAVRGVIAAQKRQPRLVHWLAITALTILVAVVTSSRRRHDPVLRAADTETCAIAGSTGTCKFAPSVRPRRPHRES